MSGEKDADVWAAAEQLMQEANEALARHEHNGRMAVIDPTNATGWKPGGERVYTKATEADEWRELGYLSTDGLHFGVDLAHAEDPHYEIAKRQYRPDFEQQLASVNRAITFTYPRRAGKNFMQQVFGDEWAAYFERQQRRARLSGFERTCGDLGYPLPKPTLDGRLIYPALFEEPWPICDTQDDLHWRLEQWWVCGVEQGPPARAWKAGVR